MLSIRWALMIATAILLCSCAPTTAPQISASESPAPVTVPTVAVIDLPCTEMNTSEGLVISYPAQSLYRNGSVFPSEEGLACLSILADWVKTWPAQSWAVTVSGEEGFGFNATKLAEKRGELLQRYFQRKGVETAAWQWQALAGQNAQLRFRGLP